MYTLVLCYLNASCVVADLVPFQQIIQSKPSTRFAISKSFPPSHPWEQEQIEQASTTFRNLPLVDKLCRFPFDDHGCAKVFLDPTDRPLSRWASPGPLARVRAREAMRCPGWLPTTGNSHESPRTHPWSRPSSRPSPVHH